MWRGKELATLPHKTDGLEQMSSLTGAPQHTDRELNLPFPFKNEALSFEVVYCYKSSCSHYFDANKVHLSFTYAKIYNFHIQRYIFALIHSVWSLCPSFSVLS